MPLAPDIREALTAMEMQRGPLSDQQKGQLIAWTIRGEPTEVESGRIGALRGRAAKQKQRSTEGKTSAASSSRRCPHCHRFPGEEARILR